MNRKGVSIIGAVFTLLILAVFGIAIVALVTTNQDIRRRQIEKEQAFYEMQAGLEYAISEIKNGGYPVVANKVLGRGVFTTAIDFPNHTILSTGISGDASKANSITYTPMGGDCLTINVTSAALSGSNLTDLGGITLTKTCENAITVDKIQISWTPNSGQTMNKVIFNGNTLFDDAAGKVSGSVVELTDATISDASSKPVNLIRFNSNMKNKQLSIVVFLTDTSYKTQALTAK